MKKVPWLRTVVTVVLTVIFVSMIYVSTKGWPLMPSPKTENVKGVVIVDTESGAEKEFMDEENVELSVKLINFLNYIPFSKESDTYEPLITITYSMKDGTEIKISANNTEVFLNGKVHKLKNAEVFVHLSRSVFFL